MAALRAAVALAFQQNEAIAHRHCDSVGPVGGIELAARGVRMLLDRTLGNTENLGDVLSRFALGGPGQHFTLARRQSNRVSRS